MYYPLQRAEDIDFGVIRYVHPSVFPYVSPLVCHGVFSRNLVTNEGHFMKLVLNVYDYDMVSHVEELPVLSFDWLNFN